MAFPINRLPALPKKYDRIEDYFTSHTPTFIAENAKIASFHLIAEGLGLVDKVEMCCLCDLLRDQGYTADEVTLESDDDGSGWYLLCQPSLWQEVTSRAGVLMTPWLYNENIDKTMARHYMRLEVECWWESMDLEERLQTVNRYAPDLIVHALNEDLPDPLIEPLFYVMAEDC